MLALARSLLQCDSNWKPRCEVDIADVCVKLVVVERELAEAEVDTGVWIAWIQYARFDQCRPRV